MKVSIVPEGGEPCVTACAVTEGNGTCGKSRHSQPSSKRANRTYGYAVIQLCGYAVSILTAKPYNFKTAQPQMPFALFEDDIISRIHTASSASLHMRLRIIGRL